MNCILLWSIFVVEIVLNINGLPIPVGQIIKYRVPSKYFKRNETSMGLISSTSEGSNSLYDYLSQIHFSSTEKSIGTTNLSPNNDDDESSSEKGDNLTTSSPDADYIEELTEENDMEEVGNFDYGDPNIPEAIQKFVNETIERLTNQYTEFMKKSSSTTTQLPSTVTEDKEEQEEDNEKIQTTTTSGETSAVNKNIEKDNTTPSNDILNKTQEQQEDDDEQEEEEELSEDEKVTIILDAPTLNETVSLESTTVEVDTQDNKIHGSDPLLGAVTDLLSSILGLQFEQKLLLEDENVEKQDSEETLNKIQNIKSNNDNPTTTTLIQESIEEETTTKSNEIDKMIENLASSVGIATEQIPTIQTDELTTDKNFNELQKIKEEVDEMDRLDAIREKINQVIEFVQKTQKEAEEEQSNLIKSQNVAVDSVIMKENTDDDVVSGTLKEIHSNLGINDDSFLETFNSNSPEEIKNFETKINESLMSKKNIANQDEQVFLPNSAKAALRYKYYDNLDF